MKRLKKILFFIVSILIIGCSREYCDDYEACNYTVDGEFALGNIKNNDICIYPEEGYCDCDGNVLDDCGICNGDGDTCE